MKQDLNSEQFVHVNKTIYFIESSVISPGISQAILNG